MALIFLSDPGHGWLVVPLADLKASGFQPSRYSFRKDGLAYLEEDCDATGYLATLKAKPDIREVPLESDAPCRDFPRFLGKG